MTSDIHEVLGRLRHLAYDEPSRRTFKKICQTLDDCSDDAILLATEYLHEHLAHWPAAERTVPRSWRRRLQRAKHEPRAAICTSLIIGGLGLSDESVINMLARPELANLQILDISTNPIGSAKLLSTVARLAHLEVLTARRIAANADSLLGWRDRAPPLTTLDLSGCDLGDDGVERLAVSPVMLGMRDLTLAECQIGTIGAERIADSVMASRLELLDLRDNNIQVDGVVALALSESLGNLQNLRIAGNAGAGYWPRQVPKTALERLEAISDSRTYWDIW